MKTKRSRKKTSHSASNKKRRKATRQHLLEAIRGTETVTTNIYSFLPLADRVRLGQVDKRFYQDENRGKIVGVYGAKNLTIEEAFEKVKEYVEFEGTPQSIDVWNNPPDCWARICEIGWGEPDQVAERIEPHMFDKDEGYDLDLIEEAFPGDEHTVMGFHQVNLHRRIMRLRLEQLEIDIENLPYAEFAPYNKLFELMKKRHVDTYKYLHAECPTLYGSSWHAYGVGSGERNGWTWNLQHLRPGRKLVFRNAEDELIEKIIKKCQNCKLLKDDVKDEYCGRKHCGSYGSRCSACTTRRKCSTCQCTCCFCTLTKCSAHGCENYMCTVEDFDEYDEETYFGLSCGFALDPEEYDIPARERSQMYCQDHKPDGAVQAQGIMY